MNRHRTLALRIFVPALLIMPIDTMGAGFDGPSTAPCSQWSSPQGQFSMAAARYTAGGQCTTYGSLGAPRTFPYTVNGKYSGSIAEETIEIAPPSTSEPSHPYGKWTTRYSCASDPWLTPDGPPYEASLLRVKCPVVSRTGPTPAQEGPRKGPDGKSLPTIGQLFALWSSAKPMTAWTLSIAERQALAAKRDADLREEKRRTDKRLKGGIQQETPFRTSLSPVVLAPTAGQRFLNQSPVPIKLMTPKGWIETQVNLDGTPMIAGRIYMVRLERKDPAGNWISHTTIPVGAVQAESPAGYSGFGAGVPPSGITTPGAWRLSAQISSPTETGWSDWVEFVVLAPVTNNALQAPKGFSK